MENILYTVSGMVLGVVLKTIPDILKYRAKLWIENRSKYNAMEILEDALNHKLQIDRSFFALTNRIGGFSDDEVRRMLMELKAIKVIKKNSEHREWWYLKSREKERIDKFKERR